MQWRVLPVRELSLRRWGGEWVASDAISGDTHLLSADAGDIVSRLCVGPATTAELVSVLKGSGENKDDTMQETLDALAGLDLIEPCPS